MCRQVPGLGLHFDRCCAPGLVLAPLYTLVWLQYAARAGSGFWGLMGCRGDIFACMTMLRVTERCLDDVYVYVRVCK